MSQAVALTLWALLALELKHFICDFVIQSEYQVRTKGIYGHMGGFLHSGLHILGTIPALLILGADLKAMAILLAAEFVIHYHADWSKIAVDKRTQWGMDDQRYWIMFGVDQLIHQLTYIGILFVMASGILA